MSSEESLVFQGGRKRRIDGPFRLTTPSTVSVTRSPSRSPALQAPPPRQASSAQSDTSATSPAPSRSPSLPLPSPSSSDSENEPPHKPKEPDEPPPRTITEAIKRAKSRGEYFPADHFIAPPTPEQLRRPRRKKQRKLLYTFVRQRVQPTSPKLYVDPRVKSRLSVDRSKLVPLEAVKVPVRQLQKEAYLVNSAEFKPAEIVGRIYKPSLRRGKRIYEDEDESLFGIGGYIIRFEDGHQYAFPIDKLDEVIERYHGVLELLEEFEHLAMAMEDEDDDAISYFDRQKGYLLAKSVVPTSSTDKSDTPDKEELNL